MSRTISKNAIVRAARNVGIDSISPGAVEETQRLFDDKLSELAEKLVAFIELTTSAKTLTKECVITFLESEGVFLYE